MTEPNATSLLGYYIMTSRFSQETLLQNQAYRVRKNIKGCVYCSPMQITKKIPPDSVLFVIELNITTNKIAGIGLCKNKMKYGYSARIYENENYNRYIYQGAYRIAREEMTEEEEQIIKIFDMICFHGSTHLKRGGGITQFPIALLYKFIAETREAASSPTPEEDTIMLKRHKKSCERLKLIEVAKIQEMEPIELFKKMFKVRMTPRANM
jgi:hypothetical protein